MGIDWDLASRIWCLVFGLLSFCAALHWQWSMDEERTNVLDFLGAGHRAAHGPGNALAGVVRTVVRSVG